MAVSFSSGIKQASKWDDGSDNDDGQKAGEHSREGGREQSHLLSMFAFPLGEFIPLMEKTFSERHVHKWEKIS